MPNILPDIRSDNQAFRPCSPCYPTQAVADPIVSHIRNPYLTFPGGVHHFHRRLDPGLGRPHGVFSDCGCMDPFRTRAPHQCTGAQGGNIGPQSLGYSITGPSCFDCYRQYHCCSLHQQTRWDPFPPPVEAGSGSVSVASYSGHISKSQTHSGLPKYDSRPLVSAEPAHHDRMKSPPQSRESDIQTVGTPVVDRFATVHNTHLPQFMALVPEPRALAIDALSQDWQGRSMYMFPPFLLLNKVIQKFRNTQMGEVILIVPWWPSQPWFPHLLRLSVDHLLRFFQYRQRPFVTTGLYLKRQVVPSARMEALMQHYQAARFSREVSKFAAAPTCRRPSTNRMYDDRWLRFTTWGRGRGFDQTIKGYRSCLASVLSCTGRAAEV